MFKNRSRSTVACIDEQIDGRDPFLVIIGGADEAQPLNSCEVYYPKTDTYFSFPTMLCSRENSSSCVFKATKDSKPDEKRTGMWIYVFGGFDKKASDEIERIRIEFDPAFALIPLIT
jgi:hypothetical protein